MPRIPVKRNSTTMSGQGPGQTINDVQGIASLQSRGLKQLGGILQDVGGDFGNIALNLQNIAIDSEANEATTAFSEEMDKQMPEIIKSPPESWADIYDQRSTNWQSQRKYKYPAAQKKADLRIRRQATNEKTSLLISGWRHHVSNERDAIASRMVQSVKDANTQQFEEMLNDHETNGIVTAEEKKYWLGRQSAYSVEYEAFQALDNPDQKQALRDAEKIIADNIDILKGNPDRKPASIVNELKNESEIRKLRNKANDNAVILKTVDEIFPAVSARGFTIAEIEAKLPQLRATEGGAWKSIADGLARADPQDTDWKSYLKAQDKIFDIWSGRTHSIDKNGAPEVLSIKTQLAQMYAVDKKFTPETWAEINYYLGTKISSEKLAVIDKGFKEVSKMYNSFWLTDSEAKDITSARRAYFEWLNYETNRKKDISIQDAVKQGRELMVSYKKGYQVGEVRDVNGVSYEYIGDNKWQAK